MAERSSVEEGQKAEKDSPCELALRFHRALPPQSLSSARDRSVEMRKSELGRAARLRRACSSGYFTLYAGFPSTKKQELRLAFGARVGTAPVRNKAKRMARETFRLNRHQLPMGIEVLISAKKGIGALSRRDMRWQILDLFKHACKLSPPSASEAVRPDDTSEHR